MPIVQPLLLVGTLTMVAWVAAIRAEEPVSPEPSPPAAPEPTVPITLGRPHGGAYDPHARLDPETQIRIALRHKAEGRPQEALNVLSMAIDGHADQARLYAVRGSLLLEAGRITPALADLERAVKLDPIDALRYRRLSGCPGGFRPLVALDPHLPVPYFNRASVRDALGDKEGAITDPDRFLQISRNQAWDDQARQLRRVLENPENARIMPRPKPHR